MFPVETQDARIGSLSVYWATQTQENKSTYPEFLTSSQSLELHQQFSNPQSFVPQKESSFEVPQISTPKVFFPPQVCAHPMYWKGWVRLEFSVFSFNSKLYQKIAAIQGLCRTDFISVSPLSSDLFLHIRPKYSVKDMYTLALSTLKPINENQSRLLGSLLNKDFFPDIDSFSLAWEKENLHYFYLKRLRLCLDVFMFFLAAKEVHASFTGPDNVFEFLNRVKGSEDAHLSSFLVVTQALITLGLTLGNVFALLQWDQQREGLDTPELKAAYDQSLKFAEASSAMAVLLVLAKGVFKVLPTSVTANLFTSFQTTNNLIAWDKFTAIEFLSFLELFHELMNWFRWRSVDTSDNPATTRDDYDNPKNSTQPIYQPIYIQDSTGVPVPSL